MIGLAERRERIQEREENEDIYARIEESVSNVYLSEGNRKLKKTDEVNFLIWNLPAVSTCPNSTAQCRKSCYARKAERLYPKVLESRKWNLSESRGYYYTSIDGRQIQWANFFVDVMIQKITPYLNKAKKQGKKIYFRIHESGDFYSQEYFNYWLYIARAFEGEPITFTAYTKSVHLVHDVPDNMTILFSLWDDTLTCDLETALSKGLPVYSAVTKEHLQDLPESYHVCMCSDCAACGKCYHDVPRNIAVLIH